ncbi:APC family permease [Leptolyngbya sp. NIES-2104]|uniref:APC family permease n=1 Tax=Leptolyngbya sp. NIES-2104 TaxID=1552121 RepID=UPI0006ECCA75|nr:APC family permease [Leptolyngbya sp. NIES-2104]GAP97567.1 amino acid permease [Leptolyngbya sp. NIES-2104]
MSNSNGSELKPTLGLVGITINAMALIAPGAFLWTTYQLQAPPDSAKNMWAAIALATCIALLTASCYATLSKAYPEAGAGSSYYYAEAAILAKEAHKHFRLARLAKFVTGWAAHLYYWVYPGIMVSFMGTLVVYIGQLFNPDFGSDWLTKALICFVFAGIIGGIALMGVSGSTLVNIVINIVQIASLTFLGLLMIVYRLGHPNVNYEHANALSVVLPHDLSGLIYQATIAILLLVGFESATAMAGEAVNPQRDIPRGVILSLFIQACICYFFEYFAANFFIGDQYTATVDGKTVTGFAAALSSGAPIGDIAKILGDTLLFGNGFLLQLIMASTVVMALLGTGLSSLSTGVRISFAMGADRELPAVFGFLHGRYNTPYLGIFFLSGLSALIGAYAVQSVDNVTIVTLVSNIGTFMLYGITCGVTLIATLEHLLDGERNPIKTIVIPLLGLVLNLAMVCGIFYYGLTGSGNAQVNSITAIGIAIAFFVAGFAYLVGDSLFKGKPLFLPPDMQQRLRDRVSAAKSR